MELSRNSRIVERLFLKRDLLAAGDPSHETIRPVLLILGGGMRGASGAGAAHALHLLGLGQAFDVVIGISTGAGISSCFLSGRETVALNASIYYEELTQGVFNMLGLFGKSVTDIDVIERVIRSGKKRVRTEEIHASRSEFFVGVTDYHEVTPILIDAKRATPDPIMAVKASMAIPGLYKGTVEVNGRRYVDGSVNPFPIRTVMEQFHPTDILVIANCTHESGKNREPTPAEKLTSLYYMKDVPSALRIMWTSRFERWQTGLEEFRALNNNVHTGILWAPTKLHMFTTHSGKLRHASERAHEETFRAFNKQP